jgi:hypothetical protein
MFVQMSGQGVQIKRIFFAAKKSRIKSKFVVLSNCLCLAKNITKKDYLVNLGGDPFPISACLPACLPVTKVT